MKNNRNVKVILLNGSPRSGKDFGAKYIQSKLPNSRIDKFARILKERTHALYGFPERKWDYYESKKDKPNLDFLGLTPRQAYINVSENYFKPLHGNAIFGSLLANDLDNYKWDYLIISDSGFYQETQVLINKYGIKNIILLRIHREGFTFDNDSRNYIYNTELCNADITNDGTDKYLKNLDVIIQGLLNYENN